MAERDQVGRALGGLNAGDLRDGQDIALGQGPFLERADGRRAANQPACGEGATELDGFGADVDHVRAARRVQM
jgi:hypothetical protein